MDAANQALGCQHLRYQGAKTRVNTRITSLALAENICQVFHGLTNILNSAAQATNIFSLRTWNWLRGGNKQDFQHVIFIAKKHYYIKEINQPNINFLESFQN